MQYPWIRFGFGKTFALVAPGAPSLWYDAQNIDGTNNSSLVDGQALAARKNLGSVGSGADLAQGTAGARPLFRLVGGVGKANGKSAVEGDGARWMFSAAITALPQPLMVARVFKMTDVAATYVHFSGFVAGAEAEMFNNGGGTLLMSDPSAAGTGQSATTGQYATSVAVFNGATSFHRLNGTQGANINTGAGSLAGFASMGEGSAGNFKAKMLVYEEIVWSGTLPAASDVEAYFTAKYGAFPQ